ncbi:unnamed protein product [Linum trigynum]
MAAAALPTTVVLRADSSKKYYLRYVHQGGDKHQCMESSGETVLSPFAKLELECAKDTPAAQGLFHIRCCSNNRYLQLAQANKETNKIDPRIVAAAKSPEEDQSKTTCTLFKVTVLSDDPTAPGGRQLSINLLHVNLNQYAHISSSPDSKYGSCLFVGDTAQDSDRAFHVTNWESLVFLPKYITFKGENGRYLSAYEGKYGHRLGFRVDEIGDPTVGFEISANHDGTVRIKSMDTGLFWQYTTSTMVVPWASGEAGTDDDDETTFFQPVKVKDNAIALRTVSPHRNYCSTMLSGYKNEDELHAMDRNVTRFAQLEVAEFVISRKIYNVDFRLTEGRIYNHNVVVKGKGVAVNSTEKPNTASVRLSYRDVKSSSWRAGLSLKVGVKSTLSVGLKILKIFKMRGQLELSAQLAGSYHWGETDDEASRVETTYQVVVPPMSKVTVAAMACTATCDVSFSHTQHDTLYNGRQVISVVDGGIYTGTQSYDMKYETKVEKLAS